MPRFRALLPALLTTSHFLPAAPRRRLYPIRKNIRISLEGHDHFPILALANDGYMRGIAAVIGGRIQVQRALGQGGFGRVYLGIDQRTGSHVALKVSQSGTHARRWAMDEIEALLQLADSPADMDTHAIRCLAAYDLAGRYICAVLPLMNRSIEDLIADGRHQLSPQQSTEIMSR